VVGSIVASDRPPAERWAALDNLRGLTVFLMIPVNAAMELDAIPARGGGTYLPLALIEARMYEIMLDDVNLPKLYSIFGEVTEGMDIVDKIAKAETDANDRPLEEVKIIKASLI